MRTFAVTERAVIWVERAHSVPDRRAVGVAADSIILATPYGSSRPREADVGPLQRADDMRVALLEGLV
jgi:hypothetical protein